MNASAIKDLHYKGYLQILKLLELHTITNLLKL